MQQLLLYLYYRRKKRRNEQKIRRFYVRPTHCVPTDIRFRLFYAYLDSADPQELCEFLRFQPQHFYELFHRIAPFMKKAHRTHSYPIGKKERLAICLRYVKLKKSFHYALGYSFGKS